MSAYSHWKTSSKVKNKLNSSIRGNIDKNSYDEGYKNVALNNLFQQNNVYANRKMIKTGNGHRRQVQRTYNKSVHWNTQDSSKIFLDDSHPYKSHNKKKSIGVSLEFTNLDNLNPMLTQTNNDCKSADDFFENKEFTGPKLNGLSVTPDVIVQWIRDTLEDATYFKIPGNVVNPDKKDILKRYGIDRESLSVDGISEASISRLYRCLFIYSIGFNELIQSLLSHSKNKISCASSIWKVFTILLEY